jgi:hypothetical protein
VADPKAVNLKLVKSKRRVGDWISSWVKYSEGLPSPELWRQWAGVALVAGAMERKVFIRTRMGELYPNLYTVLVGPPGVGKTVLTSRVWAMWAELGDNGDPNGFHLAASSLTSASIIDDLREANRRIIHPNMEITSFNSLAICSNELGVLLPEYDNSFMSKLTDIYDGHPYSERRRTRELNFKIDRPQLNLLAATTPSYLHSILPEGAWDQGFLSRTLLVYAADRITTSVFEELNFDDSLQKDLIADLRHIFALGGKMVFTEEARNAIEIWNKAGMPPVPEHPKLMHYLTRRMAHLLKLCMVASISDSDDLVITVEHFQTAQSWLINLEFFLADIFKAMVVGGDRKAMEETWYHVATLYAKKQEPVPESAIVQFLSERVPAHNVARVLDIMIRAKMLTEVTTGNAGNWYEPKARKPGT